MCSSRAYWCRVCHTTWGHWDIRNCGEGCAVQAVWSNPRPCRVHADLTEDEKKRHYDGLIAGDSDRQENIPLMNNEKKRHYDSLATRTAELQENIPPMNTENSRSSS